MNDFIKAVVSAREAKPTITFCGQQVTLEFPPMAKIQICQDIAESNAKRDLAEAEKDLKAKPIDLELWEKRTEGVEGASELKKPKNRYEQHLEQQKNQHMVRLLAPYMIHHKGKMVGDTEEARRIVREELDRNLDVMTAVAQKFGEFGQTIADQSDAEKKTQSKS